jgi:hypothetical protein
MMGRCYWELTAAQLLLRPRDAQFLQGPAAEAPMSRWDCTPLLRKARKKERSDYRREPPRFRELEIDQLYQVQASYPLQFLHNLQRIQ